MVLCSLYSEGMVRKKRSRKNALLIITAVAAILFVISMFTLMLWGNFVKSQHEDASTATVKGKITEKRTSCAKEILDSNGQPKSVSWICDSGNGIVINDISISTGGGSNPTKRPRYITEIKSLHAGDVVEVRYIKNEYGRASTDCKSCYVKKENAPQQEQRMMKNDQSPANELVP